MRSQITSAWPCLLVLLGGCQPIASDPNASDAQVADAQKPGQDQPASSLGKDASLSDSGQDDASQEQCRNSDSISLNPNECDPNGSLEDSGATSGNSKDSGSADSGPSPSLYDSGSSEDSGATSGNSKDSGSADSGPSPSLYDSGVSDDSGATSGNSKDSGSADSGPSPSLYDSGSSDEAGSVVEVDPCPGYGPVRIYDTHGLSSQAEWSLVEDPAYQFSSVRNVVIESDLARVTYEYLGDTMQASHSLYVRANSAWKRFTGSVYGDYTYWGTTITEPATSVEVVQRSGGLIAVKFHIVHTIENAVYSSLPVSIEKTVAVHRCYPGMFLGFHTDPVNIYGEREIGFGSATKLAASKTALALHPLAGGHFNLQIEQTTAPHWALGVHGENDSLLRYLFVNRPLEINSYQFSPRQWGLVTVHFIDEQFRVPERFQAFIGGMNYPDEALFELEDTPSITTASVDVDASNGAYAELLAGESSEQEITVPMAGTYTIWLRYRNPAQVTIQLETESTTNSFALEPSSQFSETTLGEPLWLDEGTHTLELLAVDGALDADLIALIPFGGNPLFPEELGRQIQPILAGTN